MTDKGRIIKAITNYSPLLCEDDNKRFLLPVNGKDQWNYSLLGLSKLTDLVALHKQISERYNVIHPKETVEDIPHDENPIAKKLDKEVKATGKLVFEIHCFDDSYRISSNNNKYSQVAAFEIVFRALQQGIDYEVQRLDQGLPLTDGMTKTQFQKHKDAMELIARYKDQQLLEIRDEMVMAQKQKETKASVKKKSGIVIAPANAKLPPMKK